MLLSSKTVSSSPQLVSTFLLWIFVLCDGVSPTAAVVLELVKDINPGSNSSLGCEFDFVTTFDDRKLFFTADNGMNGGEKQPWVSDGTQEGTRMLQQTNGFIFDPTPLEDGTGRLIFFEEYDKNTTMWVTDMTENGTMPVTVFSARKGNKFSPIVFQGQIFFALDLSLLWKTDGTETNTVLVKDFPLDDFDYIYSSVPFQDLLIISSRLSSLWVTNGTEAGTVLLATNINRPRLRATVSLNGILYFEARDGIWGTDGTPANTRRVTPEELHSDSSRPLLFRKPINNKILFTVNENKIFSYDPLSGDIQPLNLTTVPDEMADYNTSLPVYGDVPGYGAVFQFPSHGDGLIYPSVEKFFGNLFWVLDFPVDGSSLWVTDGTPQSTSIVKMFPGARPRHSELTGDSRMLIRLVNWYRVQPNYDALWVTDGTKNGTALVTVVGCYDDCDFECNFETALVNQDEVLMNGFFSNSTGGELVKTKISLVTPPQTNNSVTNAPTLVPTLTPPTFPPPTWAPSEFPSMFPSESSSSPSLQPTLSGSNVPSMFPSSEPSESQNPTSCVHPAVVDSLVAAVKPIATLFHPFISSVNLCEGTIFCLIPTADECAYAASFLGIAYYNVQIQNKPEKPKGCYRTLNGQVFFNQHIAGSPGMDKDAIVMCQACT